MFPLAQFLLPEIPDAEVAPERYKDEDSLQRVTYDEEIPNNLVIYAVGKASKDPRESHGTRNLNVKSELNRLRMFSSTCFRKKHKK